MENLPSVRSILSLATGRQEFHFVMCRERGVPLNFTSAWGIERWNDIVSFLGTLLTFSRPNTHAQLRWRSMGELLLWGQVMNTTEQYRAGECSAHLIIGVFRWYKNPNASVSSALGELVLPSFLLSLSVLSSPWQPYSRTFCLAVSSPSSSRTSSSPTSPSHLTLLGSRKL